MRLEPSPPMGWAALGALLVVLGAIGYWLLFSNLPSYDDEGYILVSARGQWEGGRLYDRVYTQYGPAFYVATDILQAVFGPVTHTHARWLTLALWLGTATACAALVRRLTSSTALPLFTAAGTFLFLYFIPDEPFHPGSVVVFLLAASLCAQALLASRAAWRGCAAVGGFAGMFLLLCKVNVGVFYFAAVIAWAALNAQSAGLRRVAPLLASIVLIALGGLLMRPLWSQPWVWVYLAVYAVGVVTTLPRLPRAPLVTPRLASTFTLAAGVTGVLVVGIIIARGTTLAGLLEGVLLEPMRHANSYSYPVDWRPGTLMAAAASLALAVAHAWTVRHSSPETADRLLIGLRVLQTAALLIGFSLLMHARVIGALFSFLAPSIWIWAVPLRTAPPDEPMRTLRGLLAVVLLVQYLHAFPIGGIQESWGTFLFFPLLALGLGEMRSWIRSRGLAHPRGLRWWRLGAVGLIVLAVAKSASVAWRVQGTHASRLDLDLPGAERIRLPEPQRTACRILSLNAAVHADLLFSLPGMFSFNLWTGLPTPTARNTTVWFTLLGDEDQQAIIARLDQTPRSAVIVEENLVRLMQEIGVPVRGRLHDYLHDRFLPVFRLDGVAFFVPRGAALAPLHIVESASPSSAAGGVQLRFRVVGDGAPIAAIEAGVLADPGRARVALDATNASAVITKIDRAGRPIGPVTAAEWPLRISGLTAVTLEVRPGHAPSAASDTVFYLLGPNREARGELRRSD